MEVAIGYHVEYALKVLIEASWRGREHELKQFRQPSEVKVDGLEKPFPITSRVDPMIFLNNYCTVKMGTARRSGHTTALLSATRLFTLPIVLFHNASMADLAIDSTCPKNENARFLSFRQLNQARGLEYDAIMVDCSFLLGGKDMQEITSMCMATLPRFPGRFCLILVG